MAVTVTIEGKKVASDPDFSFDELPLPRHMAQVVWPVGDCGIYDARDVVEDDTQHLPAGLAAFKSALVEISHFFEITNGGNGFFSLYVSFDGGDDETRIEQLNQVFAHLYDEPIGLSVL